MTPSLRDLAIGITGGSGYLGTHLAKRLLQHNTVRIVDQRAPDIPDRSSRLSFVPCDISQPAACREALRGLDMVFHRAGLAGNLPSMKDPDGFYRTNVQGTLAVLDACVANGIKRMVFDSTEMVYGNGVTSPVTEEQRPQPTSLYGATKLLAEHLVLQFAARHGLSTLIFRYCRVRDAATRDIVFNLARKVLRGEPIVLNDDGEPTIDLVDVEDVVEANLLGAASAERDEVFNVSCGEGMSLNEILGTVEARLGRGAARVSRRRLDARPPTAEHQFGPATLFMSVEKAQRRLGWRPRRGLRDMIAATVDAVVALEREATGP